MSKENRELKSKVQKILIKLGKALPPEKAPQTPDGNLDVKAYNENPIVMSAKDDMSRLSLELIRLPMTRRWLMDNGFLAGGMVLFFDNPKCKGRT